MIFIIKRISYTIGRKIHFDVIKMVSAYDEIINEKSEQLKKLNAKINSIQIVDEIKSTQEIKYSSLAKNVKTDFLLKTRYVDEKFPYAYKTVRNEFTLNNTEIINSLLHKISYKDENENIYSNIIKNISFDTFYNISTLDTDEQESIFREFFDSNEQSVLNQFILENKKFQSIKFYNYLKTMADMCDTTIYVRTSNPDDNYNNLHKDIRTLYDPNLCEGFCVVSKEYLYDYSIGKMEIC